jgi:hypothetical protein
VFDADSGIAADALSVTKIDQDSSLEDWDMSGAYISAIDADGNPVDISVAWGLDPTRSGFGDTPALDQGTLVPPYPAFLDVQATSSLLDDINGDGELGLGDTL